MTSRLFTSLFIIVSLSLSSCAMKAKHSDIAKPIEAGAAATEPAPIAAAAPDEKKEVIASPVAEAAPEAVKKAHEASTEKNVDAKQALLWLEHGNNRFIKGHLRKDGQGKKDREILMNGQHPHSIILACSDSRVPPEIVFDQRLGEIFVIRTAGEALDANVIASIEYALVSFGSKLILVMGHTSCGAIHAAIDTVNGGDAGSASLNHLVGDIHPRIKASVAKGTPQADMASEAWANASGIAEDLKKLSPIIRDAVEKGGVVIKPALYHLNSGEVTFK